jgi:Acyl-CoA dehydrogenase, N-terminal domain
VDFERPSEDDPRRQEVRSWLAVHPHPSGRDLAEAGWVVPHWPPPYGSNADPVHQLIIDEELTRTGVSRPTNPIGIGWAGPTILMAGTEEQKARYLWPALSGEEFWCQLFSEPDTGSDLASLSTSAVRLPHGCTGHHHGADHRHNGRPLVQSGLLRRRPYPGRVWHYGFLFSPALTIGGGTRAVQRNIVSELVPGLPRDP